MYYAYVLKQSKRLRVYIGYTDDLKRRTREHLKDKPGWELRYYEAYFNQKDARKREQKLKQYGSSLGQLKKRIANSLL